jgi:hypothetical protein
MTAQILEIVKYILPALVVLISAYLILNKVLGKELERKQLDIYQQNADTSLKLRLQAYERLCIFLERMHPNSMISRYYSQALSAQDLQIAMVQGIRAEWEHNVSQQLYVSSSTWQTIQAVMEQQISFINRIGSSLPLGAPAMDLIKPLTEMVMNAEGVLPTSVALEQLNKEAKVVLFGS